MVELQTFRKSLDAVWLSAWINTEHLQPEKIKLYADEFRASPVRMLILNDFLAAPIAAQLSDFLSKEAEFETVYGLYAPAQKNHGQDQTVTFEEWQQADEKNRFFKLGEFKGTSKQAGLTANFAQYLRFRYAFNDSRFADYLNQITGVETTKTNHVINLTRQQLGDYLKRHTDNDGKFSLAYVFYLARDWQTSFGGELYLIDRAGKIESVEPAYNNFVIFSVAHNTSHYVAPVTAAPNIWRRFTISGWLSKPVL